MSRPCALWSRRARRRTVPMKAAVPCRTRCRRTARRVSLDIGREAARPHRCGYRPFPVLKWKHGADFEVEASAMPELDVHAAYGHRAGLGRPPPAGPSTPRPAGPAGGRARSRTVWRSFGCRAPFSWEKASSQPAADGMLAPGALDRPEIEVPGGIGHRVAEEGRERDLGRLIALVVQTECAAADAVVDLHHRVGRDEDALGNRTRAGRVRAARAIPKGRRMRIRSW